MVSKDKIGEKRNVGGDQKGEERRGTDGRRNDIRNVGGE